MSDNVQRITVTQKFNTQPIYVNPEPDGDVTILDNSEVIEARKSYFGETFDTLQERLMNDFNGVLDKVGTVNYKGTTIHANNTYARNLVANRNKVEVLGQTIQNCLDHSSADKMYDFHGSIDENGYINITVDGTGKSFFNQLEAFIAKPSTLYTFVVEVLENSITDGTIEFGTAGSPSYFNGSKVYSLSSFNGIVKFTLSTIADFTSLSVSTGNYIRNATSGTIKFRYAIVEGDWTNKEISFVPFGLNYPETTEVIERSKNLIDLSKIKKNTALRWATGTEFFKEKAVTTDFILVKENTKYYSNYKAQILFYDLNKKYIDNYGSNTFFSEFTTQTGVNYVRLGILSDSNNNEDMSLKTDFMLSQDSQLPYEPYTERKVNINYPLASVSDSIRDRYYVKDGKKYYEQVVDTIELTGDNWTFTGIGANIPTGYTRFSISNISNLKKAGLDNLKCADLAIVPAFGDKSTEIGIGGAPATGIIYIRLNNEVLTSLNEAGVRKWLNENPQTILYELATPITTEIETEDMQSFDGQTNITTTNTVKPTLDIDIPSDLNAVVSNLMVENASLQAENQALSSELESQASSIEAQQANLDYVSMMTGVDL